ncbi:MAG: hypothetical protein IPK79_04685 [Vampirovibrionales bacterium]|nr:hypothetical protein [Vampirovibrionales bacterium]
MAAFRAFSLSAGLLWTGLALGCVGGWAVLASRLFPFLTPEALTSALSMSALAALAVLALMQARQRGLNRKRLQDERKRERAEVTAETASDAVRTLELKIAALEKALETALSTSTPAR